MFTASAVVKELLAAGVTGDALVTALERLEASSKSLRSAGAERQARYRERVKEREQTVTSDVTSVTGDAKEKFPHTPSKENIYITTPTAREADETAEAVAIWNNLASEISLPQVQKLTPKRRSSLKARLRDCGGLDGWRFAMGKIRGSPFLCGGGRDGWKADFDFVLQQSSFVKLMEGKYDDSRSQKPASTATAVADLMAERRQQAFESNPLSGEGFRDAPEADAA